jgi:hypothetical protein
VLEELQSNGYTPSEDAIARAQAGFTGLATSTYVSAMTDQHNAKVAAALRGIQNNADVHLNVLRDNPTRDALDATKDQLDATFDQAVGLANPDVVATMRDKYKGAAFQNYVSGLVDKGRLSLARQELRSDEANETLDPNDKARLLNQIDVKSRAFAAETERMWERTVKDLTITAGYGPLSSEQKDTANRVADNLPPPLRSQAKATIRAIDAQGKATQALTYAPPEVQQAHLADLRAKLYGGGASAEDIARVKVAEDIISRSEKQRDHDATVLAVAAGVAEAPSAPPTLDDRDTWAPSQEAASATVALFGLGAQVLPRPMYDSVKQAFVSGVNAEGHAAIDYLSGLGLAARQAALGKLGGSVSPAVRSAISLADINPGLAKELVDASNLDTKLPRVSNQDLLGNSDLKGVGAFAGPYQNLFYDSLEAAKTLAAHRVVSAGEDSEALEDATVVAFNEMYEGLLVEINGGPILLPPDLQDTPTNPVVDKVEETLPRLETPEAQAQVLVPTFQGRPVPLPAGATFHGLYYPGTEETVPWGKFSRSPFGQPIAPGVYVPQVDGSTVGPVVGRYTFLSGSGVEITRDLPVALSLHAVVSLRPPQAEGGMPENVQPLRNKVRTLQAAGQTATREYRDALRMLREAEAE